MIDIFLDNDKTYQDVEKYLFISLLQQAFDEFANYGNTELIASEGKCNSCDKTKTGFTFRGNHSDHYLNLIFVTADDRIIDLYECRDFKNKLICFSEYQRIYFDICPW